MEHQRIGLLLGGLETWGVPIVSEIISVKHDQTLPRWWLNLCLPSSKPALLESQSTRLYMSVL